MFDWFIKLFSNDKTKLQEALQQVEQNNQQISEMVQQLQTAMSQLRTENEQLKQTNTELLQQTSNRREIQHSNDPYIEIIGDELDSEKGLKLSLDWNPAFIEFLKENGIQGTNEEEIIKRYLAYLYLDVAQRLESKK